MWTLCTCNIYKEIRLLIKYALIVLLRTHNSDGVVDCYLGKLKSLLKHSLTENESFNDNNLNEDSTIDNNDQAPFGAQYKESPFYRDILDIRSNVERTYIVNDKMHEFNYEHDEKSELLFVTKTNFTIQH